MFEIAPGVPVTNTMITMWLVMAILIGLASFVRIGLKYLPVVSRILWSGVWVECTALWRMLAGCREKAFCNFYHIFLTILFSNWLGIAMGIIAEQSGFLRAPTSDINSTVALAAVAFLYFEYQGMKAHGFLAILDICKY